MSDQQLYEKCRFYGQAALEARRKFIGLLPEVARRRLWQEKGFESLYHFAAVLAGVSRQQVDDVINAEKRLVEFPLVRQKLTEGACSANKIIRTLSVLKPDNEKFVAEKVLPMTKSTIEQWVRDEKQKILPGQESDNRAGLLQEGPDLKPEIRKKQTEMQSKGIDINQLIQNMLENYEKQIAAGENEEIEATSRHVPLCKAHHDIEHLTVEKSYYTKDYESTNLRSIRSLIRVVTS
ncbi:hypothetical protein GF340_00895 [Candidatus Peregrinibacteria bacterium]|nr:hypothetical protein [Candidatus Peregrinibacteria bacterium]